MKIKSILQAVFIGLTALTFTACSSSSSAVNKESQAEQNIEDSLTEGLDGENAVNEDLSGTIMITGSTSVEKILNDMINEFQAVNPDVTINYTGTGSSAGISDTLSGTNTIGTASREVKEEERQGVLKDTVFAYDGIAVVVNPANPVEDITLEQLRKIYSGEITNWKEVGGFDGDIVLVSREGASGTRNAFEELIKLQEGGGLALDATVFEGNGSVQMSIAGNRNAIGYVSFSFLDDTVKALKIEGAEPTAENAKNGSYQLSRPFLFVYTENTLTKEANAFIEFAVSEEGQYFVENHGSIRVD